MRSRFLSVNAFMIRIGNSKAAKYNTAVVVAAVPEPAPVSENIAESAIDTKKSRKTGSIRLAWAAVSRSNATRNEKQIVKKISDKTV